MARPSARFWKLCALDLAAAMALAAVAFARVPAEPACSEPPAEASPGFASLAAPVAAPACLRFHLR
jgi:hypothetical protein